MYKRQEGEYGGRFIRLEEVNRLEISGECCIFYGSDSHETQTTDLKSRALRFTSII